MSRGHRYDVEATWDGTRTMFWLWCYCGWSCGPEYEDSGIKKSYRAHMSQVAYEGEEEAELDLYELMLR